MSKNRELKDNELDPKKLEILKIASSIGNNILQL